jgi:hypothetical protein
VASKYVFTTGTLGAVGLPRAIATASAGGASGSAGAADSPAAGTPPPGLAQSSLLLARSVGGAVAGTVARAARAAGEGVAGVGMSDGEMRERGFDRRDRTPVRPSSSANRAGADEDSASNYRDDNDRGRDADQSAGAPSNRIVGGLVGGVGDVTRGLVDGVTGIFVDPVRGASGGGGVAGFMRGVGRGVVGAVTRPVAGALDGIARAAGGIEGSAVGDTRRKTHRVREPRVVLDGGDVPQFSEADAAGQHLLHSLDRGAHDEERYDWHIVVESPNVVLLSTTHLFLLRDSDPDAGRGGDEFDRVSPRRMTVERCVALTDIREASASSRGGVTVYCDGVDGGRVAIPCAPRDAKAISKRIVRLMHSLGLD